MAKTLDDQSQSDRQPADPIPWLLCDALYALSRTGSWCGTADALLFHLQARIPKRRQRLVGWPTSGAAVAILTQQLIDRLRRMGVDVTVQVDSDTQEPQIRVAMLAPRSAGPAPADPDAQRALFTVEDIADCARTAQGKRWL
jgi:hypothetical protein